MCSMQLSISMNSVTNISSIILYPTYPIEVCFPDGFHSIGQIFLYADPFTIGFDKGESN